MTTFADIWPGGYFEGDPLNPYAQSSYGKYSNMSILHATYLRCIKPYVNHRHNALEIGCGRGAWSKTMLEFGMLTCIDIVPADKTHFWEYVGQHENVEYITDTTCSSLPHYFYSYMFSFGTLCHLTQEQIAEYAIGLKDKMRQKCNCFWMVADFSRYKPDHSGFGQWHDGVGTADMLEQMGYRVLDRDVGTALRDPIIWFTKE